MAKNHSRAQASGTPALEALAVAGVAYTLHPYTHDPRAISYGLEAAEALGVAPARVFKTLVVDTSHDARPALAVAVVAVSHQLDLKAVAAALGVKRAVMADPVVASRSSGYVVGGISPLGQRTVLPTVIDSSARDHATVLVSAGRRGLDVELAPTDLADLLDATWAEIAR